MSAQEIHRFAKGARAHVAHLRFILREDVRPCPGCDDDERVPPCVRCLGVGWLTDAEVAAIDQGDTP